MAGSEPQTADGQGDVKKEKKKKKLRTEVALAPSLAAGRPSLLDLIRTWASHAFAIQPPPFLLLHPPPPTVPSPRPLCLSFGLCFVSCQSSSTRGAVRPSLYICGSPHFLAPTTRSPFDINDHLTFQLTPLFMDAESLFASQYSANWTTSAVPDLPVHNRSSTSSAVNLPSPRCNSSVMLNTPISRTSPSMSHPMSGSVDSHNPLQSFTSSELSNVFSVPLDSNAFAALAASGALPPSHSQPIHPSSEQIRSSYAVQPSPFLSPTAPHIADGQYPSKLSYSHIIPNSGSQIKSKQTIVRRIAYFLRSFYISPRDDPLISPVDL